MLDPHASQKWNRGVQTKRTEVLEENANFIFPGYPHNKSPDMCMPLFVRCMLAREGSWMVWVRLLQM